MQQITSKNNIKIKDLVRLRDDSTFRYDKSSFFVEGENIIKDTPIDLIENIYISEDAALKFSYILNRIDQNKIFIVTSEVFNKIKSTQNSQGIIAVVKNNFIKSIDKIDFNKIFNILLLENIMDPGNVGTILRVAEAANINLIILSSGCCDITNPKVIRSSMSSIFRTNIMLSNNIVSDINLIKNNGFKIYCSSLASDSIKLSNCKFNNKSMIVLGNESNGISKEIYDISDYKIIIPMCGKIESLNVAIATSILCYELMRQNNYYEN